MFGGTGYLGSRIVRCLLEAGVPRVRVAARRPDKIALPENIEVLEADITDAATVRRAIAGSDGVVNAVSLYVETRKLSFSDVHVDAARSVALAAHEAGAGLVQISGLGSDATSSQPYIRARGEGEVAVHEAHPAAVIVRPPVMFSECGGLIERILAVLQRLPVFPLFGRGETRLQPVYRDDVAEAVARVLQTENGTVVECGGPEVKSYRGIVEQIADLAGITARPVPVPFPLWEIVASIGERIPGAPLTRDQVALMRRDNVASGSHPGLSDLGITPTLMSSVLQARLGGS